MMLIIATTNDNKITEIKAILNSNIDFKTYYDFSDWPEVEETGTTFKENALIKARTLVKKYSLPAVADDSGLVVDVLGTEPGVHSSRYAGPKATDKQNTAKLLANLTGFKNRRAAFVTAVAFVDEKDNEIFAEGKIEGDITEEPRGSGGFGYDPVFIPKGYEQTFAQMSPEEKNKLSHRGQAFRKLRAALKKHQITSTLPAGRQANNK